MTEKEIRKAIINKADPQIKNRKSPHWMGAVYDRNGILVSIVKIPNDHKNEMNQSKTSRIARNLQLSNDEFKKFVKCTLTRNQYLDKLEQQATKK